MATIIDNELTKIITKIYGEDIRGAIHDALAKLAGKIDDLPSSTDISNQINEIINGFDLEKSLKVKGVLPSSSNLNVYGSTKNGEYTGIYFIYNEYSYSNLPSGLKANDDAILINVNGSDTAIDADAKMGGKPFIQIVFPINGGFTGPFWVRTNLTSGWVSAGGDISDAVGDYLDNSEEFKTMIQDYINRQGGMSESTVKGLIEGYVDKDNTSNDDGKRKFNASVDARIDAKPTRSSADVLNSLRALYATTPDATQPNGWATNWYNAHDLASLMTVYNTYYAAGDPRSDLNSSVRASVADGLLGFAAFKRTEWFPTPQMYGAKGDNSTDDTKAIQNAINDNKGKTLYFPEGTYLITDTINIGYAASGPNAYTNLIFDPRACIKASSKSGSTWDQKHTETVAVSPDYPSGVKMSGTGMIAIGSQQWHDWNASVDGSNLASKRSKKFFIGGIFDSNKQFVTSIIRVSQDVYSFDMSNSVIYATDSTTGLAIGSSGWSRKNFSNTSEPDWRYSAYSAKYYREGVQFVESSMDAYVHHIYINKYSYNDKNRQNYDSQKDYENDANNKHNRASGIVIYSSDNNFDNIRVCYFKRQVKITHGTGNYFSDVHTLGYKKQYYVDRNGNTITPESVKNQDQTLKYPTYAEWNAAISNGDVVVVQAPLSDDTATYNAFYSSYYPKDTSGFHLEKKTEITLDQCYVDSDECFCYVTNEAAGSKINVSQCMLYEYKGVERDLRGFYLGSDYYSADKITVDLDGGATTNIDNPYKGQLTQLFVDGFQFFPNGYQQTNYERHTGIIISGSASGVLNKSDSLMNSTDKIKGGYFFDQTHTSNLSLERIKIVGYNWFKRGDLLVGASSGKKGSVLFRPTPLARNGTTANSKWYAICVIPVASGAGGSIQYRLTIDLGGKYFTIPLSLYKLDGKNLTVNAGASKVITNDDRTYEIGFTYVQGTSPLYGYVVWLRIVDNIVNDTFLTRIVKEVLFESTHSITPAPYNGGFEILKNSATITPSNINDKTPTPDNVVRVLCGSSKTETARIT